MESYRPENKSIKKYIIVLIKGEQDFGKSRQDR